MTDQHPDSIQRGWRLFRIDLDDGRLFPPFTPDPPPLGPRWARATCVRFPALASNHTYYDFGQHRSPSDTCGCGWRVYPDLDAATKGVRDMPSAHHRNLLHRAELVLAAVEYGGRVLGRATRNMPAAVADAVEAWTAATDETATIRAEWLQIVGPVYIAPTLARNSRRGLARRYRLASNGIRKLPQPVFAALLAGALEESADVDL